MWIKIIIISMLVLIVASLASAMFSMLKGKDNSADTIRSLSIRIGLSIALFIFLMIASALGWIEPHGVGG